MADKPVHEVEGVDAALDALSSPSSSDVFEAVDLFSSKAVAAVAAKRSLASSGGSSASVTDTLTTVANASSIQLPKGAVSMDGAGVAVLSVMVTSVLTLNDAEIKALPTTPVELVPAPGPNMLLAPVLCVAAKDFAVGYTNVGVSNTGLLFAYDGNTSGTFRAGTILETNYGFFGAGTIEQFPVPLGAYEDGNGAAFPAGGTDLRDTAIFAQALNFDGSSTPLGDFTGGDPANTLKVLVAYAVFDLT